MKTPVTDIVKVIEERILVHPDAVKNSIGWRGQACISGEVILLGQRYFFEQMVTLHLLPVRGQIMEVAP